MTDPVTPLTPYQEATAEAQVAKEGWVHRSLVAIDQAVNVILGGHPDETISARLARAALSGDRRAKTLSWVLDWFQKNHGALAIAGDAERAQTVTKIEDSSGGLPTP